MITCNDDNNNDDDDVWCNPEDEVNLENRVKFDQERIEELRDILGNETLQMILKALLEVKKKLNFKILISIIFFFLEKLYRYSNFKKSSTKR